jgi:hypothetical protein
MVCFLLASMALVSSVNSQPTYSTQDSLEHSDLYLSMRTSLLTEPMSRWGITHGYGKHEVYGVLMEMGMKGGSVLLTSLLDGAASMYCGKGASIIGSGEHESIKKYTIPFVQEAERFFPAFTKTDTFPFPEKGVWTFYVLTASCVYTASISESDIKAQKDILYLYAYMGNSVITQIRLLTESYSKKGFESR